MEFALQKTLTLITFILIGIALRVKFKKQEEYTGIKKIILNLALPATIFLALIKVEIDMHLLVLPFLAIFLNLFLFWAAGPLMLFLGIDTKSPVGRTCRMLLPSLAPGLSCFPFIAEFLGDQYLAKSAMADLGNKFFVLLILYLVAMRWYYQNHQGLSVNSISRIKSLVYEMLKEPVNMFIGAALLLLGAGLSLNNLPVFAQETLVRLGALMTPLVLLFIGLAVRVKKQQFSLIFSMLMFRAGVSLILVAILAVGFSFPVKNDILLMASFSLSACSFWPFAHITSVNALEKKTVQKTFDSDFAIGLLAFSLPLSTLLILTLFSSGTLFTNTLNLGLLGLGCITAGVIPVVLKKLTSLKVNLLSEEFSDSRA